MPSHRPRPSGRPFSSLTGHALATALAGFLVSFGAAAHNHTPANPAPAQPTDWRTANQRVGELLRGHMDALRWENAQPPDLWAQPPALAKPGQPVLTLERALRTARAARPDLIAPPQLNTLEQAQVRQATAEWAHGVQQAWWEAVAAREAMGHLTPAVNATQAATELARRMAAVGNWSTARAANEELRWLATQNQWATARQRARAAELRLRQYLQTKPGTANATTALPNALPALPKLEAQDLEALVSQALANHANWTKAEAQALRLDATLSDVDHQKLADAIAKSLPTDNPAGLAQRPLTQPWSHRWDEAIEARAQADAISAQVRADVAMATDALQSAHEGAARAEQTLQIRQQLLEDMQQRYNGMLNSTWDLVEAGRNRAEAAMALTQARHNAWLAHGALQAVLAGLPYQAANVGPEATPSNAPQGH